MNNSLKTLAILLATFLPVAAIAVPSQQLDIAGGEYVGGGEESVITDDLEFSVFAIATPGNGNGNLSESEILDPATNFFLSVALVGDFVEGDPLGDIGTIVINGIAYTAADFVWGIPPGGDDHPELGGHGVFPTWYLEIAYDYTSDEACGTYNVQDSAGSGADYTESGSYCNQFDVDITGLTGDLNVHFDTYVSSGENCVLNDQELLECSSTGTIESFAPFSHDAGTSVPEPGTLALLGAGLLALGAARRRRKK